MGSIPESRWSPGGECGNPLQYSCLENPMDRGACWATVHGVAETERLSTHAHMAIPCPQWEGKGRLCPTHLWLISCEPNQSVPNLVALLVCIPLLLHGIPRYFHMELMPGTFHARTAFFALQNCPWAEISLLHPPILWCCNWGSARSPLQGTQGSHLCISSLDLLQVTAG